MSSTIIEKIKKLLALATSDNANEAAAAAAAAQRLMTEHQISQSALGGEAEESARRESDPLFSSGERIPGWLNVLSAGICRQNSVFSWSTRDDTGAKCVKMIGRPSDVANARFLFAYLRSEIERLAQKHAIGGGRSYAESYRLGAVSGALEAMRKTSQEVRARATGEALVKIDNRMSEARALAPEGLRPGRRVRGSDSDAFSRGKRAGGHLHGSTPIGAGGTRLLGK